MASLLNLPKDIVIKIALSLDLPEILHLCQTSKKFNTNVCQNKYFWIGKLYRDFKIGYLSISPDGTGDPKEYYKFFYKKDFYLKKNPIIFDRFEYILLEAANEDLIDIVKYLIRTVVSVKPGVPIFGGRGLSSVRSVKKEGLKNMLNTALYRASKEGHMYLSKLLVEMERINPWYGVRGSAQGCHMDIIKYMIEKSDVDKYENANMGLIYAAKSGCLDIVEYLIMEEDVLDLGDALVAATRENHINVTIYLIEIMKKWKMLYTKYLKEALSSVSDIYNHDKMINLLKNALKESYDSKL